MSSFWVQPLEVSGRWLSLQTDIGGSCFLDEFDALAKARDDAQEIGKIKRVVNALLQLLDARNGCLSLATLRFTIRIPKSDDSARKALLTAFLRPLPISLADLQLLTWAIEGMSGAGIEMLLEAGKRFLVLYGKSTKHKPGEDQALGCVERGYLILEAIKRQSVLNNRMFIGDRAALVRGLRA